VALWMPMMVVAAVGLARAIIEWCGRIKYEQVRAASTTAILQVMPGGAAVCDVRSDGTSLRLETPPEVARPGLPAPGDPASVCIGMSEVGRC